MPDVYREGIRSGVESDLAGEQVIESLNYQFRKVTKARGHFPADDAVVKLLWPAILNIEDERARERAARAAQAGYPARFIESPQDHLYTRRPDVQPHPRRRNGMLLSTTEGCHVTRAVAAR